MVLTVGERGTTGRCGGPADGRGGIRPRLPDKVLGLEFAALDFTAPHRNQFSYKLEGFDPEWVPLARPSRRVTYTNLNPGHYTFRVRGANSDGRWNEEGLAVPVDVAAAALGDALGLRRLLAAPGRRRARPGARRSSASSTREAEYARELESRVQERTQRAVGAPARPGAASTTSWPRPASPTR